MSFKIFAKFLFFSKNSAEVLLRDIAKNEINQNLALSVKNNFLTIIILLYPKTICEQIIIIIVMSHRLCARWGQPFTRSDSSMPVGLVQDGTILVHCVDTTLLYRPATLCMDVLVGIFRSLWQILCV